MFKKESFNLRRKKIEKNREKIIQILDKYLGDDYLLFVFGSVAKNIEKRSSDIDLAIYREKPISLKTITEIKQELEERVGTLRDIDLVNLSDRDINIKLLKNILNEGIPWKETKNSKELLRDLKKRLINLKK